MSKEPSKTSLLNSKKLEHASKLPKKLKGSLKNKFDSMDFSLRERINNKFIEHLQSSK